ncbi:DUF2510 domain-containing protein [Tessaracoccus sp. ZS01]|nr:DUF2510 domain-containing protein [Tessaracoccus sp. ZS01]
MTYTSIVIGGTNMTQQHPAGWYTQPDGSSRYWDGTQWADQAAQATQTTAAARRPWYTKKRIIIPVVALIGLIAILPKGGDDTEQAAPLAGVSATAETTSVAPVEETTAEPLQETTPAAATTEVAALEPTAEAAPETTPVEPVEEPVVEEPADPGLSVTQGQAVVSAENYISFAPFSRTGLIGQLEYEGFATADAEFAADAIGADWMEQAALKAESYLEFTAFSESGLVDQLEYEGFTSEEALYGVANVTVDWMEQAALKAKSYLEMGGFSRSGLVDQLLYEGFSQAQAEHGADSVGL